MDNAPTKLGLIIAILALATVLAKGIFDHWDDFFPKAKTATAAASSITSTAAPILTTNGESGDGASESGGTPAGETLPAGDVAMQNKATAMFMDLSGGQNQEQVHLVQSARQKVSSQVWKIIPAEESGSYYLVSQDSVHHWNNHCLEVMLGGANDQIGIGLMRGTKKQHWELIPADPGYYFIKSKFYEKTINAPNAEAIERPLIMYFFWKGNNEQWRFTPAE